MRESSSILEQVTKEFSHYRESRGGKRSHYPESLKELVRAALAENHSATEIAHCAQISVDSVLNWKVSPSQLKELQVVCSAARICLPSGASIELSELTPEVLKMLWRMP